MLKCFQISCSCYVKILVQLYLLFLNTFALNRACDQLILLHSIDHTYLAHEQRSTAPPPFWPPGTSLEKDSGGIGSGGSGGRRRNALTDNDENIESIQTDDWPALFGNPLATSRTNAKLCGLLIDLDTRGAFENTKENIWKGRAAGWRMRLLEKRVNVGSKTAVYKDACAFDQG